MASLAKDIFLMLLIVGEFSASAKTRLLVALDANFLKKSINLDDYDAFYLYENDHLNSVSPTRKCHVDSFRNQESVEKCIEYFSKGEFGFFDRLVVGVFDTDAALGGRLRTAYGIKVGLQEDLARAMTHKAVMKKRLADKNSPYLIPGLVDKRTVSLDEIREFYAMHAADGIVIKPVKGTSSMGVEMIKTEVKLEQVLKNLSNDYKETSLYGYVIEKFVEGPVTFLDGYVMNGELKILVPAQENILPPQYYIDGIIDRVESKIEQSAEYFPHVQKILDALEYKNGVFHLEMIGGEKPEDKFFLEIGPRPGEGNDAAFIHLGFDELKAYFLDQLGEEYQDYPENGINQCYFQLYFPSLGGEKNLGTYQRIKRLKVPKVGGFIKSVNFNSRLLSKTFRTPSMHIKTLLTIVFSGPQNQKEELRKLVLEVQKDLEDPRKTLLEVVH